MSLYLATKLGVGDVSCPDLLIQTMYCFFAPPSPQPPPRYVQLWGIVTGSPGTLRCITGFAVFVDGVVISWRLYIAATVATWIRVEASL